MSYNVNIPTVTDKILQSFGQLRANFRAINNAFADNHVGLTQNDSISGMHTVLTLRTVTDPATSASQIALYNKVVSSIPAIFFRPSSNQTPIQLTYPSIKADSSNTQYSFVAGPFIVYGGFIANVGLGVPVNLTPGTNIRSVDVILANFKPATSSASIPVAAATNIVGASFDITTGLNADGSTVDAYYFAVGQ
jgi:hypothetical protein